MERIQYVSTIVIVRNVERSFIPLQTAFQKRQRRCQSLFSGVVEMAKMFLQAQPASQRGQTRKVRFSVAHFALPRKSSGDGAARSVVQITTLEPLTSTRA